MDYKADKSCRLLRMNEQLTRGEVLRKESLVSAFDVTPKTVQRDLESLRIYLLENVKVIFAMTAKRLLPVGADERRSAYRKGSVCDRQGADREPSVQTKKNSMS